MLSIGLVSDTHYQDRLFELPVGLRDLWAGADFILHAGDVGELDALDLLGGFAPTIAVHGNDEPERTKQELPCQQLVAAHGVRILLWHSHYSDPIEEKANRKGTWGPKLQRIANRGRQVGARIVIYGHTHVPMVCRCSDVLLINPGALSSGSYFTRQMVSSVGRLQILDDGEANVTLFDVVAKQARVFDVADPEEDFGLLAEQYWDWIVETDLIPVVDALGKIAYENVRAVVRAVVPLYQRCLSDGRMRREDLIKAIRSSDLITPNDKKGILAAIARHR
jgi:hypothetical protein